MQTIFPVVQEDVVRDGTLIEHTQAVESVIRTMHGHLHELLSLEDLAAVASLSPAHFTRIFSRLIGIPPIEFLAALRFQEARRLLLMTPMKITDICFEVGYSSTGSFSSRFTRLVGLSPRLMRQRAQRFEPQVVEASEPLPEKIVSIPSKNTLAGRISVPESFRGTIYVGLFSSPVPQGAPVKCCKLNAAGTYAWQGIADGFYYLRAAAFPQAAGLQLSLLPGKRLLVGSNIRPLVIHNGYVTGEPDLVLHEPRLTDPPLVMGLPLL